MLSQVKGGAGTLQNETYPRPKRWAGDDIYVSFFVGFAGMKK